MKLVRYRESLVWVRMGRGCTVAGCRNGVGGCCKAARIIQGALHRIEIHIYRWFLVTGSSVKLKGGVIRLI